MNVYNMLKSMENGSYELNINHTDDHDSYLMPKIKATDIELGGAFELRSGGAYFKTVSKVDGNDSLSPRVPFSSTEAATKCILPFSSQLSTQYTLQGDDSFDFVGTSKTVYFPVRTEGALVSRYYAKAGSVAATEIVNMKVYRGTSAGDITPDNLRYEADLPASLWSVGNGGVFSFGIEEYAIDPFTNISELDYVVGEGSILIFSSSAPFSAKFNTSQTIPFLQVDQHTITEREALTKYETRTPHAGMEIDITGGSLTFPLAIGKNYIGGGILVPLDVLEFTFGTDATSDYYEYAGDLPCFFDGKKNFTITSNATNVTIRPGIDIERIAGGTEEFYGPSREFDLANPGNVTFFTEGTLNKGDKVRLWFDSDKATSSSTLDYMYKQVRKVA